MRKWRRTFGASESLDRRVYRSHRWWQVKQVALAKAGHRCQKCGSAQSLACHHIKPILKGGDAFSLANIEVLCHECHVNCHWRRAPRDPEWQKFEEELFLS